MRNKDRWRQCGRKDRFRSEHDAEYRARKLGLFAYQCPHCDGWHLTKRREWR